jgi:hypothetical protein
LPLLVAQSVTSLREDMNTTAGLAVCSWGSL